MFKKNHVSIFYDYNFKLADGSYIGEKLCRSHSHAEKKRIEYEKKYNCSVSSEYWKKIVKKNGRVISGF